MVTSSSRHWRAANSSCFDLGSTALHSLSCSQTNTGDKPRLGARLHLRFPIECSLTRTFQVVLHKATLAGSRLCASFGRSSKIGSRMAFAPRRSTEPLSAPGDPGTPHPSGRYLGGPVLKRGT